MIMLRYQPDRQSIFAWLRVVAVHEAYELCRRERRYAHLEDLVHADGWEAVIAGAISIDDAVEVRLVLQLLAELPERQRDDLALLIAGFSYREIAERTGGRTFTNVNKHISKGWARIRRAQPRGPRGATFEGGSSS